MLTDEEIGKVVRRAFEKKLDGNEIKMLIAVAMATNDKGVCTVSNEIFTKRLSNISERSVTTYLASLKSKGFLNIIQNKHKHERWIYIRGIESKVYVAPEPQNMSEAQRKFKLRYPNREIDCEAPPDIDIDLLLAQMEKSRFLKNANNMSFKSCCIKYYKQIIAGWRDVEEMPQKSNFSTGRQYTEAEMNALFQNIEEVEV